jgi:glyceraldehyde 3-phosphate dehydrogenase
VNKVFLAGINGFGRFGLHLLRYWLLNNNTANFNIGFINDRLLSIDKMKNIILTDKYVHIGNYVTSSDDNLIKFNICGVNKTIAFTNCSDQNIWWNDEVDFFFECSGENTSKLNAAKFLRGKVRCVLISATSYDSDGIFIYGYNHNLLDAEKHKIFSYGSCTVNAYVPFANWVNKKFTVVSSDVTIVHNIPQWQLSVPSNKSPRIKSCTLEKVAPTLLKFINEKNFAVHYCLIPYSGVSLITIRFQVRTRFVTRQHIINTLKHKIRQGNLKGLVQFDQYFPTDINTYKFTNASVVLFEDSVRVIGNNLYFYGVFDNENSVNRYFDIINHYSSTINPNITNV